MEEEDKSEVADQVSEFRKEALNSTDKISEISKALKEALDNQSVSISKTEDEIASSSQAEETQAAIVTGISNSLSDLLGVQKEILDSLKGLNSSINAVTQQQNVGMDGNNIGGVGNALSPVSFLGMGMAGGGAAITTASFNGDGGGGGGDVSYSGEMNTSPGLTPEVNKSITEFADKYNINPNALAGVLNTESKFDPSIKGGDGGNYTGIFQLQSEQIPGLTEKALGKSLTRDEYAELSFEEQLKVYKQYIADALGGEENIDDFFTGDAEQDTARLWALQLAPSNAKNIDYNDPNSVISGSKQSDIISDPRGGVTVGSSTGSLNVGGLLEEQSKTQLTLNWGGELPENIVEGTNEITLTDPISGESFGVNFEVEEVNGNFLTTGQVTLSQDTDLEGISGAAGDPVEVSAELAQDLADQIGASLELPDLETPATPEAMGDNNTSMIPEETPTSVDLEETTVEADASTSERISEQQAQQTQTASADYSESATTPKLFTGSNWHRQVNDYYDMA